MLPRCLVWLVNTSRSVGAFPLWLFVVFVLPMDPSEIFIWNVRGLDSSVRKDTVREMVYTLQVDVVCCQETKMQYISRGDILTMLGVEFSGFVFLPSAGASGGIMVAWKRIVGHTGAQRVDNHSVSVQFCKNDGVPWWLTCVYGPQTDADKVLFLQEIRDIRVVCVGPWVIAGDFNLIYKASDKNNMNLNRAMMGRFRNVINDLALREVQLHGRKFTWSNQQINPILVKLDRVFCSADWDSFFPNVLLQSSASQDSYHCPLILGLKDNFYEKKRFHFESFWPKMEGFFDTAVCLEFC
jgi:exonuclease III